MSMIGHNGGPQEGYILVNRAMLSHKIVGAGQPVKPHKPNLPTYSRYEAWQDLIMMASYQDQDVKIGGKTYQLRMGEAVCARSFLSVRWNWSDKTVRAFLQRLIDHGMVLKSRDEKGQKANRLSVCNYSQYQRPETKWGQDRGQQKGQQKGQQNNELTPCKQTINMFDENEKGQTKGPTKGPQYKEYKINKKTNLKVSQKDKSDLQIALDEYNQLAERAGLAKAKMLTKSRTPKLRARLDEHGLDGWRQALGNVERSSFLCGEQPGRNWKASFDFLLQESSFVKVLEGQYGNGRVSKPQISKERARELLEKYKAPPPIIGEDAR